MSNLKVPTLQEIANFSHSVEECIEYAQRNMILARLVQPKKPVLPKNYTAAELRAHADEVDTFEKEIETWNDKDAEIKKHNAEVESVIFDFIKSEAFLNVPDKYLDKVWAKAWEQGHSAGLCEVYRCACSLAEIFE